jgi:single-strand DNA-binding protein
MLYGTAAGNTGKDAEYKTTQGGQELCSFSVAAEVGYGDSKQTIWVDVTRWGKGAQGLANLLRKGSRVTAVGELSTREHNGKTYMQMRADQVAIQGTPQGDSRPDSPGSAPPVDDLDSDIPF